MVATTRILVMVFVAAKVEIIQRRIYDVIKFIIQIKK